MESVPTPAYDTRITLLLEYFDVDPGRVFHEVASASPDLAKGLKLMRQAVCCQVPLIVQMQGMPFAGPGIPTWESLRDAYSMNLRLMLTLWAGDDWEKQARVDDIRRTVSLECKAVVGKDLATMRERHARVF